MRVTVINFCSSAIDMLRYTTPQSWENAGTDDYDYMLVTWRASPEVLRWLELHPKVQHRIWPGDPSLGYVPNLRAMMNFGYDEGFKLNDYVVLTNTDVYYGRNWLVNLVRRSSEDVIANSTHLTRNAIWNLSSRKSPTPFIVVDLGLTEPGKFDVDRFWTTHDSMVEDIALTEDQLGDWDACHAMPQVLHRKYWEKCGPWRLVATRGEPPDREFFHKCHDAGARFVVCRDSIIYHAEAVERLEERPEWTSGMPEGR